MTITVGVMARAMSATRITKRIGRRRGKVTRRRRRERGGGSEGEAVSLSRGTAITSSNPPEDRAPTAPSTSPRSPGGRLRPKSPPSAKARFLGTESDTPRPRSPGVEPPRGTQNHQTHQTDVRGDEIETARASKPPPAEAPGHSPANRSTGSPRPSSSVSTGCRGDDQDRKRGGDHQKENSTARPLAEVESTSCPEEALAQDSLAASVAPAFDPEIAGTTINAARRIASERAYPQEE